MQPSDVAGPRARAVGDRRRRARLTLLAVAVALAALAARPSEAQAAESGCVLRLSPGFGTTIPANTPALSYFVRLAQVDARLGPPLGFHVREATSGQELPLEIREENEGMYLLFPTKPFIVGERYDIEFLNPCFGDRRVASYFIVGPVAPLPSASGSAKTSDYQPDARYNCYGSDYWVDGTAVKIDLDPSDELTAFLPVVSITTKVDGVRWSRTTYGDQIWGSFRPDPMLFLRRADILYSTCGHPVRGSGGPSSCAEQPLDLSPGRHRVEIQPHIAGSTKDPKPTAFDIDIRCDDGDVDAGAVDQTPRKPPTTTDAGRLPPGGSEMPPTEHVGGGGGCALGASSSPAAGAFVVTCAAIAMSLRRRRRR